MEIFSTISADAKIKNLKFLNPYLVTTVNNESDTSTSINEPRALRYSSRDSD